MHVKPRNLLALIGYFVVVVGPITSCILFSRGYGLLVGQGAVSVSAAIAAATSTAQAPLDPITCNGRSMVPGERCIESQGGRVTNSIYTYSEKQQVEQAQKDQAEEQARQDLANARDPVQTRLLGMLLFGLGLATVVPTIVWYRRVQRQAKAGSLRYATFGSLLGRDDGERTR